MGVASDDELMVANYIGIGVRCGLSVKEALLVPVGLLSDMWDIYKKSHGLDEAPKKRHRKKRR